MFFTDCAHLVQKYPDLARVFRQLDSALEAMGSAELIRPDDLASLLNVEPNQIRSALEMFALQGVLSQVEIVECPHCYVATFLPDYQQALSEEGEYRCT